jgi:hypothetical protein
MERIWLTVEATSKPLPLLTEPKLSPTVPIHPPTCGTMKL